MTYQSYNLNIPAANNNPSTDQPNMQTNTNSISNLIAFDHFGFANNSGGTHKQVTLTNEAAPGVPGTTSGVLYANAQGGQSWPFWQNTAPGSPFQLLGAQTIGANGNIFLPGGLIMQWGSKTNAGASGTVTFPLTPFPSGNPPFMVQLTAFTVNSGSSNRPCSVLTTTAANFTYGINSGNANDSLFWMAIGN